MILTRRAALSGFAVACTGLAGCQSGPPPARPFPDPSFAQNGQMRLDVNEIEVVTTYQAPMVAPNVEHRFPVTPERMMQRWARERLVPTGGSLRRGRFIIEDASVREVALPRQGGIRGAFTTQQGFSYEGAVRATLEILSPTGDRREAFATAEARRSQSINENASIQDREAAAGDLCSALMASFNTEMERQIRAFLGPFLR